MGTFFGALLIDSIPTPGGPIPLLTLCLQGGALLRSYLLLLCSEVWVRVVWDIHWGYVWTSQINRRLATTKYPESFASLQSKGLWGVIVLTALPLPLSVASWVGGSLQIHPKCILYDLDAHSKDDSLSF